MSNKTISEKYVDFDKDIIVKKKFILPNFSSTYILKVGE